MQELVFLEPSTGALRVQACACVCATPVCLQPALPSFSCLTSKEHTHVSWHTMAFLMEPVVQDRTEAR